MSTRIIVPPKAAEQPTAPASAHELGEKVSAAFWVGVFVTIAGVVVASVACLPGGFWGHWLWGVGLAVVIGVLVACYCGFCWTVAAASRQWRVDDQIRYRIWRLEDEERVRQLAAAATAREDVVSGDLDHDHNPATLTDAQRLHLVALAVLERHYLDGSPVTREAMTGEGVCTQPEWNAVNQLLLEIGLKKGYKMREGIDFASAWRWWRGAVRIEEGEAWVRTSRGQERLVELAA